MKTSKTGVLGGNRACLCKDGTYSTKCCDGSIWAQGYGSTVGRTIPESANRYLVERCDNGHTHHVHIDGSSLVVGNVYYMNFANSHHNGCYTILSEGGGAGLLLNSVDLYADCDTCLAST